jgi:diguanylate cyclase (GGDEF)-like protein/PAS domain S-box-containing protein
LIVDDNEQNRYLLRSLLSAHGFETQEAENGAEALDTARRQPPELVISDLLMPTMDGYTLLREWKNDDRLSAVPFVVYTATYTQAEDERLAHDLGADAFLVKPTEPDAFLERIERVLEDSSRQARSPKRPVTGGAEADRRYSQALVRKLEDRSAELARHVQELRAAKAQIERLNRLYSALSAINQLIVHVPSRETLLDSVCRILVERGGFTLAWIGMLDDDGRTIRLAARHGGNVAMFEQVGPFTLDPPLRTPSEIALGEDRLFLSNRLEQESLLSDIWPVFERYDLHSTAACPLRVAGEAIGVIGIFSNEPDFFDDALIQLIEEVGGDVSFALENYRRDARRIEAEESLKSAEEFNRLSRQVIEADPNGVMITSAADHDNPILYVNPAFERITGYSREEVLDRDPRFLVGDDHDQRELYEIREAVSHRREGKALLRNYRKDGTLFWNELTMAPVLDSDGRPTHFVGVINDITDRKQYEEQLERQYSQDALTGLASRNLLRDRVEQSIAAADHERRRMALFFIDLDHFKRINDSLGRTAGDTVLKEIAARLKACSSRRDTAARVSGDEFVILVADYSGSADLTRRARKIREALDAPIGIGERQMKITGSIGIAVYPANGEDYDTLLRNADIAMYRAKQHGAEGIQFYTEDMNADALQRVDLESRLRQAVEDRSMTLYYQPVIDLKTDRVVGAEALLRWFDGDSLRPPNEFIPLAEETGLIIPIGRQVLEKAATQARNWQDEGRDLSMSVNLSARQFADPSLVDHIRTALEQSRLDAGRLRLEVTESVVMENAEEAARVLRELQALGLGVSIDDFGTGYSSLAYLKRFPIDQFKIDQSFIQDLEDRDESEAIVMAIIRLARSLGLATVAEGVETAAHRDYLAHAGCDLAQGYFYSPPMPAEGFLRWLDERKED